MASNDLCRMMTSGARLTAAVSWHTSVTKSVSVSPPGCWPYLCALLLSDDDDDDVAAATALAACCCGGCISGDIVTTATPVVVNPNQKHYSKHSLHVKQNVVFCPPPHVRVDEYIYAHHNVLRNQCYDPNRKLVLKLLWCRKHKTNLSQENNADPSSYFNEHITSLLHKTKRKEKRLLIDMTTKRVFI